MLSRSPHNPSPYDDDWEDQPAQGPFYKWGLGTMLPLVILYFGLHCLITGHGEFGQRFTLTVDGKNALALGIAEISLAVFLHCHYFWGNIYNQIWFAVLGKILALCGFIVGLGVLIVRVGVFGRT